MPAPKAAPEEDPDPTPYLFVSLEQKRIDQTKPYDAKKACWVPDEKEGYLLGEIKATKGDVVTVGLPGGEVCTAQKKKKTNQRVVWTSSISTTQISRRCQKLFDEYFSIYTIYNYTRIALVSLRHG